MYGKKGVDSPNFGKKRTEQQIEKIKGENNPMYGKHHTEEARQKIRETKIKNEDSKGKKNPMYGVHRFGKKNPMYGVHRFNNEAPNWQDGKSFEEYPKEFKLIKQSILERDNYTCQCPDCSIEPPKRLHIHHIDYNKQNNIPENLITLCTSCHSKINGKKKRQYFIEFYQNIMMGKLMGCFL